MEDISCFGVVDSSLCISLRPLHEDPLTQGPKALISVQGAVQWKGSNKAVKHDARCRTYFCPIHVLLGLISRMLTVQVPAIGSPVAAAHVWELGEFENRINHDKSAGQAAASISASTCKQRQINSDDVGCGLSTLERLRFFNEFCFGHQVTSGGII